MQDVNHKRDDNDDDAAVEHYYDGAVPPIQHYRMDDPPTGHDDNDGSQIELQQGEENKMGGAQLSENAADNNQHDVNKELLHHVNDNNNNIAMNNGDDGQERLNNETAQNTKVVVVGNNDAVLAQQEEGQAKEAHGKTVNDNNNDMMVMNNGDTASSSSKQPFQNNNMLSSSNQQVFPFHEILQEIQKFQTMNGGNNANNVNIPTSHPSFTKIMDILINNGIEKETNKVWENKFNVLKQYKEKYGECGIPYTDPDLGEWMTYHRQLKADADNTTTSSSSLLHPLTQSRLAKLDEIGFEWTTPVWDRRLQELTDYVNQHGHTDVPIQHPTGLGVWMINQKFNLKDMSPQRIAALDSINFIWNHNRKKRNNKMWDVRYSELCLYVDKHGSANVPTTAGAHSKLSKWVGKQREEYKKFVNKQSSQLDRHRIERLNEIGFTWSMQQWTAVPWEERFEALKKFKEEHGHLKIPRSHPYFGNWPNWQRTQFKLYLKNKESSKLNRDKIDKLISIGFFKQHEVNALYASGVEENL
eukprot:scaffold3158_cov47-Cyclotella_meneghiniana.AAC.5